MKNVETARAAPSGAVDVSHHGCRRDTCVQLATFRFCHILGPDALCERVCPVLSSFARTGDGSTHGVLSRRTKPTWPIGLNRSCERGSGGTADALASGASWSNPVGVRIPPSAPHHKEGPIPLGSFVSPAETPVGRSPVAASRPLSRSAWDLAHGSLRVRESLAAFIAIAGDQRQRSTLSLRWPCAARFEMSAVVLPRFAPAK